MDRPTDDSANDEMIEEIRAGLEVALLQQSTLEEHLRLLQRTVTRQRRELTRIVRAQQRAAIDRMVSRLK